MAVLQFFSTINQQSLTMSLGMSNGVHFNFVWFYKTIKQNSINLNLFNRLDQKYLNSFSPIIILYYALIFFIFFYQITRRKEIIANAVWKEFRCVAAIMEGYWKKVRNELLSFKKV